MPLTLKAINAELAKRGHLVRLERGSGDYFYFMGGDAREWLDRTVPVPKVSSLTLEQWVQEFNRLKKVNHEIAKGRPTNKIRNNQ
jgi:hypothetical protein